MAHKHAWDHNIMWPIIKYILFLIAKKKAKTQEWVSDLV